jgi:DNA-binding NtrC family response regulator
VIAAMKTLIIDDEPNLRQVYARLLAYEGYEVAQASRGREGVEKASTDTEIILCDVRLPDVSGLDILPQLKKKAPFAAVIMLTAFGTIADGVEAMRRGAFDYLTKGDSDDQLLLRVAQAHAHAVEQKKLLQNTPSSLFTFGRLLGNSPTFVQAVQMAKAMAATDAAVLLTGQTGTGKELFAQAIHTGGPRAGKPFVAINCAALPKETLESELFGHTKGAFTGASGDKKGFVEEAENGTLFLDEIGELPLELQAKLLRFLETGEFYRLGETKPRRVQVRLLSATNKNLESLSADGLFRPDLYYRLAVVEIALPALAARGPADIRLLAEHFYTQFAHKHNKPSIGLIEAQIQLLTSLPWPGNIRELRNTMERAILLGFDVAVKAGNTFPNTPQKENSAPDFTFNLAAMERALILKALAYTEGNKTQAAKILGIGLTTLYRKIEELGV